MSDPRNSVTVRAARPGEEEALGTHAQRAFRIGVPQWWIEYFRTNVHLHLADTLVAEVDGRYAGQAAALRLEMALAGEDVPVRGIAAVGVAPEFRRAGVAEALMRETLRRGRKRGEALSALYPFQMPFYRKFGYARCEWAEHLQVTPSLLSPSPLRRNVRRFVRERDTAAVQAVYEAWRQGRTGPLARSEWWWNARVLDRVSDGALYLDPRSGEVTGYLLYDVAAEPSALGSQHARIKELVARDAESFRGLVGFLEALGEQFGRMDLVLPPGLAPVVLANDDASDRLPPFGMYHATGTSMSGVMVRILDVARAFALHPGPARRGLRAKIGLDVDDPVFPMQSRGFDVTFGAKGPQVTLGTRATERLALRIDRLAQVYTAAVPARVLLAQGAIEGSAKAAAVLDEAFAGEAPFLLPLNGF
jgi:predicted acetyltransferase